jgi:hypothetical protein
LRHGKIVRRRRATTLPMPIEVVERVRALASKRKKKQKGDNIRLENWNYEEHRREEELEVRQREEEYIIPMHQVGEEEEDQMLEDEGTDDDSVQSAPQNEHDRQLLLKDIFGEDDSDEELDKELGIAGEEHQFAGEQAVEQPAEKVYGRGHRVAVPNRYYTMMASMDRIAESFSAESAYGLKLSVKKGINLFGYDAILSVVKEVKQMLDQDVWEGQDSKELTTEEWKTVINSMIFLKEKFTAEGLFQKLKARLVAGGHQQKKELFEDTKTAPTVATQSVFMIAAIAATEGRAVAAVDVPGAFLKAPISKDDPPIWMKLDQFLTAVLIRLDNTYEQYVRPDGTCIVRLKKSLYGTIQAARAWYDKLASDLERLGFIRNSMDMCVFNRKEKDGSQTTICTHVDDLFISAATEEAIDIIITQLDNIYSDEQGKITIQRGKKIEYVGMVFIFNNNRSVSVTMDGYIFDLLDGLNNITGVVGTPATNNLFRVREDSRKLDVDEKEFYHSTIAKLLYLAKRVRPDLLVAISFLVRRVQSPDADDWDKMVRVIQYIRGTKQYGITLSGENNISITAFVDASYAVHSDMKSHTGSIITLGKGPVYAKSGIQRLNTTSSAESELVALSDSTGQVIWTRQFLEQQGYTVGPATVYEDNQSAIKLAENGRSNSSRTRHIAIRYFFVSDKIASGEIKVEYLNTSDMIADILTKPLQGALFRRLRSLLLNWEERGEENTTMDDEK